MKLAAWVLRSGDVIEYDDHIWAVRKAELASGPRTWGEVRVNLRRVDDKLDHVMYAQEDEKFKGVRIRGARYTESQWRHLIDGEYEGRPY